MRSEQDLAESRFFQGRLARDLLDTDLYYGDDLVTHCVDVEFVEMAIRELIARVNSTWSNVQTVVAPAVAGIAFGVLLAQALSCDLLIARKHFGKATRGHIRKVSLRSYTGGDDVTLGISERQLARAGTVLLADDFLSTGAALGALATFFKPENVVGAAVLFDKPGLGGRKYLEDFGIEVVSFRTLASGPVIY